ncbi:MULTISPECIES: hypothetical protein [unclassified Ruegeria]|uniref:hypothetical protein n=1 Tax=unclassified Ruegeria TaxID=2625375 RepID=UPI0014878AEC|nr:MULTISPECIES: hypothetical protein [unclassified Ruegeria]
MIAPEGFNSLAYFRNAVRSEINRRVLSTLGVSSWREFDEIENNSERELAFPGGHLLPVAANWVVAGAALSSNLDLEFVVNDRAQLVKISSAFLRPTVRLVRSTDKEIPAPIHLDILKMYEDGELVSAMCKKDFLKLSALAPSLARGMVVNYVTGCLDLSVLESACQFKSLKEELDTVREQLRNRIAGLSGVTVEKGAAQAPPLFWSDRETGSILNMLSPYNGFPLLIREEKCHEALEYLGVEGERETPIEDMQPSEQILVEFEENPANKSEIKGRLFPDMSMREFDKHWWAASQINPSLSAPGRKASLDHS